MTTDENLLDPEFLALLASMPELPDRLRDELAVKTELPSNIRKLCVRAARRAGWRVRKILRAVIGPYGWKLDPPWFDKMPEWEALTELEQFALRTWCLEISPTYVRAKVEALYRSARRVGWRVRKIIHAGDSEIPKALVRQLWPHLTKQLPRDPRRNVEVSTVWQLLAIPEQDINCLGNWNFRSGPAHYYRLYQILESLATLDEVQPQDEVLPKSDGRSRY